jgi:hypothetical protein
VAKDRYPHPIGRQSQCAANGAHCALLATIMFLGEQQDIIDPEAAVRVDFRGITHDARGRRLVSRIEEQNRPASVIDQLHQTGAQAAAA